MAYTQDNRLLQFASALGQDELLIEQLQGVEGMSRPFDFHVELLAEAGKDIDPSSLLGTKATIAIATLTEEPRYINGLIAAFEQTSGDSEFDNYEAHIVPSMWQATLSTNCRTFQDLQPIDIIKAVLDPYKLSMRDETSGSFPTLDYCTQYNESDFAFVSRIAERYGIYYWFEHSDGDHTLVFGSTTSGYDSDPTEVNYAPHETEAESWYHALVTDIRATATMVTGKHSTRDYDLSGRAAMDVDAQSSAQTAGQNTFEAFAYPSAGSAHVKVLGSLSKLADKSKAADVLKAARDASDVGFNTFVGAITARDCYPGGMFTLKKHPREDWNRDYLVTELVHHAMQTPDFRSGDNVPNAYSARFAAIESSRLFRPLARTPRPIIPGPQSALVVTPSGEDMYVDKLGRVCVQFFWDREREKDKLDNTWVRVAQPWAGNGWGTFFWPRKNDEVLVQFLNGDPDAPIVIGSVYNGVNVPKHELPAESTKTGILTRSVKGGTASTANEFFFEDKSGSELVYLHAEKDMSNTVENNNVRSVGASESISVGASRTVTVANVQNTHIKKNHFLTVDADSNYKIGGNHKEEISADTHMKYGSNLNEKVGVNYSMDIGMNRDEKVGMNASLEAGMNLSLKGGMQVVIEGGLELTIKAGAGFINIGPAGVAISGPMVLINSGGAAGSGTAPSPVAPQPPDPPPDSESKEDAKGS